MFKEIKFEIPKKKNPIKGGFCVLSAVSAQLELF